MAIRGKTTRKVMGRWKKRRERERENEPSTRSLNGFYLLYKPFLRTLDSQFLAQRGLAPAEQLITVTPNHWHASSGLHSLLPGSFLYGQSVWKELRVCECIYICLHESIQRQKKGIIVWGSQSYKTKCIVCISPPLTLSLFNLSTPQVHWSHVFHLI